MIRLLSLGLLLAMTTSGCSTMAMFPRNMGVRPDAPSPTADANVQGECKRWHPATEPPPAEVAAVRTACERYLTHIVWAQELAEAYRSRATFNEWSIYFAGTIALVGLSLVSGLGVAAVASVETLGLIGVSTGFSSAFFGFLDNRQRAGFYNTAANAISTALADATVKMTTCSSVPPSNPACKAGANDSPLITCYCEATTTLARNVSQAANTLEDRLYAAAAAAADSEAVREANRQLQATATLAQTAAVVKIDPSSGKAGQKIVITTAGVDLTKDKEWLQVRVAGDQVQATDITATQLTIVAPTIQPPPPLPFSAVIQVRVRAGIVPGERPFIYTP